MSNDARKLHAYCMEQYPEHCKLQLKQFFLQNNDTNVCKRVHAQTQVLHMHAQAVSSLTMIPPKTQAAMGARHAELSNAIRRSV